MVKILKGMASQTRMSADQGDVSPHTYSVDSRLSICTVIMESDR